jgi:hypothetical protein
MFTSFAATPRRLEHMRLSRNLKLENLLDNTFIVCGDFNGTLVQRIPHVNCLPSDAPNDNIEIFTEFLH